MANSGIPLKQLASSAGHLARRGGLIAKTSRSTIPPRKLKRQDSVRVRHGLAQRRREVAGEKYRDRFPEPWCRKEVLAAAQAQRPIDLDPA